MIGRGAILVLMLAGSLFAGEPPGSYYTNEAWGYKVRVPKGWNESAVAGDTKWVASRHLGKRDLEGRLEDRDWMTMERPEMWVIGFPKTKDAVANPFGNYREYVTGNTDFIRFGDDHEFVAEDDIVVDGVKVTTYEIRKGKKKKIGRRVVCWVFHFDDIDFAVQFKVLEWHISDYQSSFKGCLKSFKRVERTKSLGGAASSGGTQITSRADAEKLDPAKRERALRDAVDAHFRGQIDALPDDWRSKQTKNCLVLTNADKKFVKATVAHTDAVVAHLEKLFGKSADYRPPFILRIFATDEQWRAYGTDNEKVGALTRDIAIYSGKGYVKDSSWETLNKALFARWLEDRNPKLEGTLPEWLKEGFNHYMKMMRSKGKRVTFSNESWDRDEIRLQIKRGAYEPILTIMSRGIHGWGEQKSMEGHERERQQRVLVIWLMRDGNRGKYKNLIRNFVLNTAIALEDYEELWRKKNPPGKDTEDYELTVQGVLNAKRDEILKAAWERTFTGWEDKDWNRLTTVWLSAAK